MNDLTRRPGDSDTHCVTPTPTAVTDTGTNIVVTLAHTYSRARQHTVRATIITVHTYMYAITATNGRSPTASPHYKH